MVYGKKGVVVRVLYLVASIFLWLVTFGGRLFQSSTVILCYHGITSFQVNEFRLQMQLVADRVSAIDTRRVRQGRRWGPSVIITFDDAFENLLNNALPTINELKIPISIYVVTGCMGGKPPWLANSNHKDEYNKLMSDEQVKLLGTNPLVTFGVHSHTHPSLTSIDADFVKMELRQSKEKLEDLISRKVDSLAFPHGAFNASILSVAKSCGLTQLLTLEEKMINAHQFQGKMGRFSMEPDVWPIEFRLTVDGAYSWLFYFRRMIRLLKNL